MPDSRWFPIGSRLATTLARAQLSAVPAHLAGAVTSGVPTGTRLAVNAVPVDNGKALVNLSSEALSADPGASRRDVGPADEDAGARSRRSARCRWPSTAPRSSCRVA